MESKIECRLEQLLPIVAKLTDKYTSKESSSITYEKAQMLMEAVLYCIDEVYNAEDLSTLVAKTEDLNMIYLTGYEMIKGKVKNALSLFNNLSVYFCDYGNYYLQAVMKDMAVFFTKYDPQFSPQDHIVELDYPIRLTEEGVSGINYIEQYLQSLEQEQKYLNKYTREMIENILYNYDKDYKKMPINIYDVVKAALKQ